MMMMIMMAAPMLVSGGGTNWLCLEKQIPWVNLILNCVLKFHFYGLLLLNILHTILGTT
jgi:hypothetical protein